MILLVCIEISCLKVLGGVPGLKRSAVLETPDALTSLGSAQLTAFAQFSPAVRINTLLPVFRKPASSPGCFAGLRTGAVWLNWCFLSTGAN